MTAARVTEAERVEVGRYYLVPCVKVDRGNRHHMHSFIHGWLPVAGPKHGDAEIIGFAHEHFHYDWRFMSQRHLDWCGDGPGQVFGYVEFNRSILAMEWRRRRCLRVMPEYPAPRVVPWTRSLEAAYASTKIKPDCRTCPHRGIPLNGLPERADGSTVCPGHGLAWNLRTGAMVRRVGT